MAIEVGKNRLEALGDVEESADLIRYYCDQFVANDGFDHPMGNLGDPTVHTRSVLKPHGVWAVISPFNSRCSVGRPVGRRPGGRQRSRVQAIQRRAAVRGQARRDRGSGRAAEGRLNMVSGPGGTVGAELQENEGVDGLLFTGSYEIGFNQIFKTFSKRFRCRSSSSMGGKNPAIVSARADLEEAAEGVMRSAFGYGRSEVLACSRVYVQAPVYEAFLEALIAKTKGIAIGDPTDRKVWLGPLVNAKARQSTRPRSPRPNAMAIVLGGEMLAGHGTDLYAAPTIVADLPADHRIWREELFVPVVAVAPVKSLDEAFERANDTIYGLTAGSSARIARRSSASRSRSKRA